jgi:hypothetical protein
VFHGVWGDEGRGKDVIGNGSSRLLCQALVSAGWPADSEEGLWCGVRGGGKGCIRNAGTAGCPPAYLPVQHDRADDLSGDHRWPKMPGIQGKCYMRGLMIKPFDGRFYSRYRFQVAAEGLHFRPKFRGILLGILLNRHYSLPKIDNGGITLQGHSLGHTTKSPLHFAQNR